MAMSAETLGKAIADAVLDDNADESGKAQCKEFWEKIAKEIILHIQNNAEVAPGISVSTTGSAAAQTGATTGTGAIL